MTTYKLTPNAPSPLTGFITPIIGWHFSAPTALDVFEGTRFIQRAGWTWDIHPDPDDEGLQRLSITPKVSRPNVVPLQVKNTQWFCLDGKEIVILDNAIVESDYQVEEFTLPTTV